ncbi:hypothetical protein RRG08_060457 [Elysia crispata]|uniref:Uncharacterized protein n=1 Tax=Elysia crispata TaxID=231223 RepID=A0AAE1E8T9_9GAST|nr:hypothetical protein RRG08_060457 [Elysia crispata]
MANETKPKWQRRLSFSSEELFSSKSEVRCPKFFDLCPLTDGVGQQGSGPEMLGVFPSRSKSSIVFGLLSLLSLFHPFSLSFLLSSYCSRAESSACVVGQVKRVNESWRSAQAYQVISGDIDRPIDGHLGRVRFLPGFRRKWVSLDRAAERD